MPINKKDREKDLSERLKEEADVVEKEIEEYIDKNHYLVTATEPVLEISFASAEPVRLAVRNEIVKRYKKAGYTVNDYTDNRYPSEKFRLGLG